MPIRSIRSRLFVTFGALTTVICILFAGITWLFAVITEDDVVKQVMHTEALYIQSVYADSGTLVEPRMDYIQFFNNTTELPPLIRAGVEEYQHEKEFDIGGHNYHFEHFNFTPEEPFLLVIDASQIVVIDSLNQLIGWFVSIATLIMLTLALSMARLLSNRTAKPLERLATQVSQRAEGELFTSTEAKRHDEIGHLARAFERAFNDIEGLLRREKNFVRDVSHELRTPLSILQNTLLLSGDAPIDKTDKLLIGQVTEALKNTVEVLLALARAENLTTERLAIRPVLERSVLALHQSHANTSFNVRVDVDEHFSVAGNPLLIQLMCQNLVNNGFYHGGSGAMSIRDEVNKLIFENTVEQQQDMHHQGIGHGQFLVQRIAETLGWRVEIEQTNARYRVNIHTKAPADTSCQ